MADTMKSMYIACATGLGMGDFTKIKTGPERTALINKIADMYCNATDNGDELIRSQTISALMLMFWGEIGKMADKCKAVSELEYDDFASKLYECINVACTYRAWQEGKHTAEACIRAAIGSRGAAAILYESNLDKNKANVNNYSLDATINDDEGHETTRMDLLEDDSFERSQGDLAAVMMIQSIINKGDLISSIVLDNIAFNDCQKETKELKTGIAVNTEVDEDGNEITTEEEYKYTVGHTEFSEYYLVKALSNLPDSYKAYFLSKYDVKESALDAAIERIRSVNNTKLYKFIRDTLTKQRAALSCWLAAQ